MSISLPFRVQELKLEEQQSQLDQELRQYYSMDGKRKYPGAPRCILGSTNPTGGVTRSHEGLRKVWSLSRKGHGSVVAHMLGTQKIPSSVPSLLVESIGKDTCLKPWIAAASQNSHSVLI